jgi:uncharacterized protein (TIGR02246 family)
MRRTLTRWLLLTTAALIYCRQSADDVTADAAAARVEVAAALQRYQQAARMVDPVAMAAFFTPTGVLFEPGIRPIVTRDSIRAFLASFPGVQVHTATATPDTIDVFGDRAYLWGSYFEHLSFPGQPASEQHGKFITEWVRQPDGTWLIARFYRIPLPPPRG